jgi:hypothetical protein
MTSHYGEGSTVIEEPIFNRDEGSSTKNPIKAPTFASAGIPRERLSDFTTTDYTLQERPFFVPIGKGGILTALQKLDGQLLNVSGIDALRCAWKMCS